MLIRFSLFAHLLLLCFLAIPESLSAQSLGPLEGKLLDVPQQIYYSFPGFSARAGGAAGSQVTMRTYYLNEFRGYVFYENEESFDADGRLSDPDRVKELTAMDFEAAVAELDFSTRATENLRLGATIRLYSYFGGFLDPWIEGFHGAFDLANASRERFPQNQTSISIKNKLGVEIELEGAALLLGDIALYGNYLLYADRDRAIALAAAAELPSGGQGTPAGNGYLDIGVDLLYEQSLGDRFVLHLQQGVVIPGETFVAGSRERPLPMSQSLVGLEWRVADSTSLLVQSRIYTSPLRSEEELLHDLFGAADQFELPVTSLQFGIKQRRSSWGWQLYFEEDALTHEGPDFILSAGVTHHF